VAPRAQGGGIGGGKPNEAFTDRCECFCPGAGGWGTQSLPLASVGDCELLYRDSFRIRAILKAKGIPPHTGGSGGEAIRN